MRIKRSLVLQVVGITLLALSADYSLLTHGSSPVAQRSGVHFTLDGQPFYFGGTNIHYLPWGSAYEVNNALRAAVDMHLRVIRTFASLVVGSPTDRSVKTIWDIHSQGSSSNMNVHGVYYQYWNTATKSQGFNDGPNGLERLDYVVARASQLHLKLLIALVDNWEFTGGMDQYLAWHGLKDHDAFFIDPRVRQDYKDWIAHLLGHVNVFTGVRYRDDPTIFAWELANEPEASSISILLPWVKEMSAYIKSIDPHHLVGVGSVGHNIAVEASVPTIDFATEHLYPRYWNITIAQSNQVIKNSITSAHHAGKPFLLEEFGYSKAHPSQASVYRRWTRIVYDDGGAGFMFWRLVGAADGGGFPPDNGEGFDIHPDATAAAKVLSQAAQWMDSKR